MSVCAASVFGKATIAGTEVDFCIAAAARGHGGRDSYRLRLSNGYDSGLQLLRHGHLTIHA